MKQQLIIPMSGLGSRFVRAGYSDPKPLIKVHGHPMIEWVLRMFPGEDDPIFICRKDHIEQTPMQEILTRLKPKGRIVVIEGAKLGPVAALMAAENDLDDHRPALVTYCDYYMRWNYRGFLNLVRGGEYSGAVPCYTGFHPHLLPEHNLYASCRVDEEGNLAEIREKYSFESDKKKSLHSPGVYYFSSGNLLKEYGRRLMEREDSLNGEYYVSMIYNHMVRDGLKVTVPTEIEHFCQWGTPQDLDEYLYWTNVAGRRGK